MKSKVMFYNLVVLAFSTFSLSTAYSDSLCTLEKGYKIYNKSNAVKNNASTGRNNIKTICIDDLINVKIGGESLKRQKINIKGKTQYISSKGVLKRGEDLHSSKFRMKKGAPLFNDSKGGKTSAHFTGESTNVEYAKVFLDKNKKPTIRNKRVKSLIVQHIRRDRWLMKSGWARLSAFSSNINDLVDTDVSKTVEIKKPVKEVKIIEHKTYKEMYVCPAYLGDKVPVLDSSLNEVVDNLRVFESVNLVEGEKKDFAIIDGRDKVFSVVELDDVERKIESKRLVDEKYKCHALEKTAPTDRIKPQNEVKIKKEKPFSKNHYICTNDGGKLNARNKKMKAVTKISNEEKVTQISNEIKKKSGLKFVNIKYKSKKLWVAEKFLTSSLSSCPSSAENKLYICTKSGDSLSVRTDSFKLIQKLNQRSKVNRISSEIRRHKGLSYINVTYGKNRTGWVAKKYVSKNKSSCAKPKNKGISGIKFRTARGLIRMHNNRAGFCGSVDYSPERGGESYAAPVTACVLTRFAQEWKTKHCPSGGACKMTIGDISHPKYRKFDGHNTHTNGNCIDFRPIRKRGSGPLTFRSRDYSLTKTKQFLRLAKKLGATNVYFNDPRTRSKKAGKLSEYVGGHDNHIHLCFHNNKRVRNRCAAYKPNYNVCPKAQSLFQTKFMKKRIGRK